MDSEALRKMQAPFKEQYRAEPGAAIITLKARGELDSASIACKVETGRALAVAGLHPATGGSGIELCSGDMLLEALVACAGVTLKAVATALDIEVRSGTVSAEGDLDFRGTLGVDKTAPVGFRDIRLSFDNAISNRHCRFTVRQDNRTREMQLFIEDVGSRNGTIADDTIVNEEPVQVRHGSRIHIGSTTMIVIEVPK